MDIDTIVASWAEQLNLVNKNQLGENKSFYYTDKSGLSSVYADETAQRIKFQKDLLGTTLPEVTKVSNEVIRKKLVDFWDKSVVNSPTLLVTSIHYMTIDGPRFVTSTEAEGTIVEMEAEWQIETMPILSFSGAPVGGSIFKKWRNDISFGLLSIYDQ